MKTSRALIILSLLLLYSCTTRNVREKAIMYKTVYNWEGPATQAFEAFTYCYFRVPSSTEELVRFIEHAMQVTPDESLFFGDGEYLIKELKRHPEHFASYSDSCFYYTPKINGMREGVCVYSPQYHLNRMSEMTWEERGLFESFMCTRLYGDDNEVILEAEEYLFRKPFDEGLKSIMAGYSTYYIRTDVDPSACLRTLFSYDNREGNLTYYSVNIPVENVFVYNNKTGLLETCPNDGIIPSPSYLNCIKRYVENSLADYPEISMIVFYGPLCL